MTEKTTNKSNNTRKAIKQAILRIEKGKPRVVAKNRKLSVVAVAEEAGISNASIHNNYPELAEFIRTKTNKATRQQRDEKHEALKREREKCRDLRQNLTELEADLSRITSINARLFIENQDLQAIKKSTNVITLGKK
ncbi:MAG: hypothetical protein ACI909_004078 [Planctomycetota bacterium]|jgi:hypothetical protein